MPLEELAAVAKKKNCSAIVVCGAIEPSNQVVSKDLPRLVKESSVPVMVGGLASVYRCDAIDRAGAEALGRDIHHGLQRIAVTLS